MSDVGKALYVTIKPWWQSKSVWVGVIISLVGAGDALIQSQLLGSEVADYVVLATGILQLILRKVTKQPIA